VEVACNPHGTYFLQKLIAFLAASRNRDLLLLTEDILNHASRLATDERGTYVLQGLVFANPWAIELREFRELFSMLRS
jgi:hypothetical protein